jgi:hypothetical protein
LRAIVVVAVAAAAAANASAESVNKIGRLPLGRRLLHCKQQLIRMLREEEAALNDRLKV